MKLPHLLLCLTLSSITVHAAPSLIPQPFKVEEKAGKLTLSQTCTINFPKGLTNEGKLLRTALKQRRGIEATFDKQAQVLLRLDNSPAVKALGDEGYTLDVTPKGVIIKSSTPQGVFYGTQSFLQLIPTEPSNDTFTLETVSIQDKPRFPWRASHMDVSRHFYDVEDVKRYIDIMAMHKFNTFHWHLTDHQGWRMEVEKYPKLTSVGAWRRIEKIEDYSTRAFPERETPEEIKARLIKQGFYKEIDGVPHYGGFYTKQQMKDVVAYAAARHITVVPEIDVPGHTQAALAAYPELGCDNIEKPYEVWVKFGLGPAILCASNENTYDVLEDIFDEVMEIFPSKNIHIGADEAAPGIKQHWDKCSICQEKIEKEGLKDGHGLQNYFVDRVKKYLTSKGRNTVIWGEAFFNGMEKDTIVMSWWGTRDGERAAKHGNPVVMTPWSTCYFNMKVDPNENGPGVRLSHLPTEMVYNYEPSPLRYSPEMRKNIIGYQPCIWTEQIPTFKDVEFLTYPRIAASAEVAWTQMEQRNYSDFKKRLDEHFKRFDVLGLHYYVDVPVDARQNFFNKSIQTNLRTAFPDAKIFVKYDGKGQEYTQPITLDKTTKIETWSVARASDISSLPYSITYQKLDAKPVTPKTSKPGLKYTLHKLKERKANLNGASEMSSGVLPELKLPSDAKGDNFAMIAEGYIKINEGEKFSMKYTKVDDILKISIAGKEMINSQRKQDSASFTLSPGYYPIKIEFYEYGGAEIMNIELRDKDGKQVTDFSKLLVH